MHKTTELRVPALEIQQTAKRILYTFAVDGKTLPQFAAVSRLHRDTESMLGGYQRPEVVSHIAGIRSYLESDDPMLPNAIVIALDRRVRFQSAQRTVAGTYSRVGELIIPIDPNWSEADKPGWIVDGQQRTAAVREAQIESFPLCITAFIADTDTEQRTQFILVNSTKPLPKGLVYELLPETEGTLPKQFRTRRFPARLLQRLNHGRNSPLWHMINTPTVPEGVIKDNSMLKMLENSLTDGALYYLRDPYAGTGQVEAMLDVLHDYWEAVSLVFPDAWDLPARRSRLTHGVGIVSLGFVMDAICDRFLPNAFPTRDEFVEDLAALEPVCRWTSGLWDFGAIQRKWNDLQNTPRDIQLLTDHLLEQYRLLVLGTGKHLRVAGS
jgi:DGQHR domain-containing protein